MQKRKLAYKIAKIYLWHGRGAGLNDLVSGHIQKFFVYGGSIALLDYYFHIKLSPFLIIILIVLATFLNIYVGYWDAKRGFWKIQNDIQSRELTPFWGEIENKLTRIENKITKYEKVFEKFL